jgi:L-methionine (R)-S-oxide reductase
MRSGRGLTASRYEPQSGDVRFAPHGWNPPTPTTGKVAAYVEALECIRALIDGERDEIAVQATMVAELHHRLDHFNWTGFYRVTAPGVLKIGPYQGGHGCLTIPFARGVCGKCAREARTQIVADVTQVPYHLACASSTRSEIVVPVIDSAGRVRAVLDVDSDAVGAFDEVDAGALEAVSRWAGAVFDD